MPITKSRSFWFRLAPTLAVVGIFGLGFLGQPENNVWLNQTPLWGRNDIFSDFSDILIGSPMTVWRGAPNIHTQRDYRFAEIKYEVIHNEMGLRDDEISEPKPSGTYRVVNLGDSATWGFNLLDRSETYSDQLEELLAETIDAGEAPRGIRRYEVINAGTIGFSSFQGAQFLRAWLEDLDPDLVTVYLGNNDVGRARISDSSRIPATLGRLRRDLSHNFFYLLLRRAYFAIRWQSVVDSQAALEEEAFQLKKTEGFQSKEKYYETLVRVSPEEYSRNLREMVALVAATGAHTLLLKVPMNLAWPSSVGQPKLSIAFRMRYWCPVQIEPGYLAHALAGEPPGERPLPGHPYLSLVTEAQFRRVFGTRADDVHRALQVDAVNPNTPYRERIAAMHNLGVWNLIHGRTDAAARILENASRLIVECACVIPIDVAMNHYVRGIVELNRGRRSQAFGHLLASRDAWPFAMTPDYEVQFDKVVREPTRSGLTYRAYSRKQTLNIGGPG